MGRLSNEPIIQHFSHPHPLHLSSPPQQPSLTPLICASCTLPAYSGLVYACAPCRFALHAACSSAPPLIHHPSHGAHPLALLPSPAYPEGSFDCDACARRGTGFSYHCAACGVDLHPLCASMPLSVACAAHAHPLALAFAPPYDNKGFSCDVCGDMGSSQWLYRCAACEFDAHVGCTSQQQQVVRSVSMGAAGSPRATGVVQGVAVNRTGSGGTQGLVRGGSTGGMVRQMVQGLVNTATQSIGNKFVPGYGGDVQINGRGRGGPGAWNGPGQGGRGRGGGCNGWNGNGGGRGGRGAAWNNQNSAQGNAGDGSGNWNGYADGGGDGSGNWNEYVNSSGWDGSGAWNGYVGSDNSNDGGYGDGGGNGVDYGAVADAVVGMGTAVLNAFGGGQSNDSS